VFRASVLKAEPDEWYVLSTEHFIIMRMKAQPFLFCVLLLTTVSVAQSPEPAAGDAVHPRLHLAVKTDRKVYSIRDNMRVELELRNVGTEGVYVQRSSLCLGSGVWIRALTIQYSPH